MPPNLQYQPSLQPVFSCGVEPPNTEEKRKTLTTGFSLTEKGKRLSHSSFPKEKG